jgi:NADPH:quinone reductase-like Zn-dependent oxidoreductase
MRAIVCIKSGPPEVLLLQEVEQPIPKANEVLIRIYATVVAIEDVDMRASGSFVGFGKVKQTILGHYLAGEVEVVGKDVKRFKAGDQV